MRYLIAFSVFVSLIFLAGTVAAQQKVKVPTVAVCMEKSIHAFADAIEVGRAEADRLLLQSFQAGTCVMLPRLVTLPGVTVGPPRTDFEGDTFYIVDVREPGGAFALGWPNAGRGMEFVEPEL